MEPAREQFYQRRIAALEEKVAEGNIRPAVIDRRITQGSRSLMVRHMERADLNGTRNLPQSRRFESEKSQGNVA